MAAARRIHSSVLVLRLPASRPSAWCRRRRAPLPPSSKPPGRCGLELECTTPSAGDGRPLRRRFRWWFLRRLGVFWRCSSVVLSWPPDGGHREERDGEHGQQVDGAHGAGQARDRRSGSWSGRSAGSWFRRRTADRRWSGSGWCRRPGRRRCRGPPGPRRSPGRSSGRMIRNSRRRSPRAVEPGRLDEVPGNVLESGEQHQAHEGRGQPDVRNRHGEQHDVRVGEPADLVRVRAGCRPGAGGCR